MNAKKILVHPTSPQKFSNINFKTVILAYSQPNNINNLTQMPTK